MAIGIYSRRPFSELHRSNISKSHIGKKHTNKAKEKNRIAHLGKTPWNKNLTKETDDRIKKYAISISTTRKILFSEGKLKSSKKGKTYKEIYKQDYSKIGFQKAELNPMRNQTICKKVSVSNTGKKRTDETKRKFRENRALQIFPIKDTSIEIKIQSFLKYLNIEFFTHQYISQITHAYQCDILINPQPNFMAEKKTIIECDGDYWHGNPVKFSNLNQTQKEQIEEDAYRNEELRFAGFEVIRLWECEIKKMELRDFKSILFSKLNMTREVII